MRRILAGVLAVGLAIVGAAACGPSFQAVYECDVRFEHCYALDQGSASVDARKACWRDWLRGYTYGQSSDRIEYGATRLSQLSLDPTLPAEDSPRSSRTVAAPIPTNAFAPPPNIIDGRGQADPPPSTSVALHAPGSECADGCKRSWTSCRADCRGASCGGCDDAYRSCMSSCFAGESTDRRENPSR